MYKFRINHLIKNFNTFRKKIETKSIRICDIMSGESEKLLVALQRTANCDNDRHGSSKATNYDIMKNTNIRVMFNFLFLISFAICNPDI